MNLKITWFLISFMFEACLFVFNNSMLLLLYEIFVIGFSIFCSIRVEIFGNSTYVKYTCWYEARFGHAESPRIDLSRLLSEQNPVTFVI
jgi:hypothetical protein